jgi:thymidylate synthase (FAD)
MARIIVPEAEAIIDKEFPVLDHGFVRLVDYLGGDSRIVAAARVSYGSGTKSQKEDNTLIRYLMRNMHTSPFEQVILTFHAKLPIFVARQWVRHRTARINEFSGRYSVMPDEFYLPEVKEIRKQSRNNKQGRSDDAVPRELQEKVLDILKRGQAAAYASYEELLHEDIARELARINLTLGAYTQWYWQIDLNNLFHFLKLRMDKHAQYEIRQYAEVMAKMTKAVAPVAYEAFEEYVLYAANLPRSVKERMIKLLSPMASSSPEAADLLKSISEN